MASIRQRGNKFQVRVTFDGRTLTQTFSTKSDAAKWARLTQTDLERGLIRPKGGAPTLGDVIDDYLSRVTSSKRGAAQEACILRQWRRSDLAAKPVTEIKGADLAAARDALLERLSTGSVLRHLGALGGVFTWARTDLGVIDSNPVQAIRKPPPGRARDRRLLPGELDRVIAAAAASPDLGAIITLALQTAMRRSELLSLTWDHIDLGRRVALLPFTKNGDARAVPLSPSAVEILAQMPRRADGKVFQKHPSNLSAAFTRAVARARRAYEAECRDRGEAPERDFLRDFHFHDLRHAATTRFIENGLNLLETSAITGHRDLRMLKRYTHLRAEDLAAKLARLSERGAA